MNSLNINLIIDDLFLDSSYRNFLKFYKPLYGEKVTKPLSIAKIRAGVESYLGKTISETHLFYLPERPSDTLSQLLTALSKDIVREDEGLPPDFDELPIPEVSLVDYVRDVLNVDTDKLLERSEEAQFHACDYVAINAARFAAQCESAILFADDPVYAKAAGCPELISICYRGEFTRMTLDVDWINVDYIFCRAYGVNP